jgi:Ca2+-transporting ATPase
MSRDVALSEDGRHWHAETPEQVAQEIASDQSVGLSAPEAALRMETFGRNVLQQAQTWPRLRRLGRQFADVLIALLLVAAAVSGFLLGAWIDALAVAAIVLINAVLGYAQETRADAALEHLKGLQSPTAAVIRDGNNLVVAASDVVPGDLIVLETGDLVAADARVVDSVRLEIAEASLTGESLPIQKTVEPVDRRSGVADRRSMVFAGTTVVRGRGKALVIATGFQTEMGRIAASITDSPPPTPLQVELARVGRRLAIVAVAAGLLVFAAGLVQDYPIETMALTAVAMAVAAIPEGLPAVVTVTLAGGLRRMAEQRAIVRRLPAVEALGAVDVICTDKTGTLTRGMLSATKVVAGGQEHDIGTTDAPRPVARQLLITAALCNDARRTPDGYMGDPTDVALIEAVETSGLSPEVLRRDRPRIDESGFDSRRKRMSTLHRVRNGFELHLKGAPEVVISRSTRLARDGEIVPMDESLRTSLLAEAERLADQGMRALAFGYRELSDRPDDPADMESGLTYLGVVGLSDEMRPEVPDSVAKAGGAGVRTVMVTGDHLTTAQSVAKMVGIAGGTMHGSELGTIDQDELTRTVHEYAVFARVDPVDKVKIVEAWQRSGSTVAMTGDGVNDAPALRTADVGVAMGSGTDVSREAAALVLTDDNYATIVAAITEGRRIFHNLRNVVHYLLSANASEVIYMLVGFTFFGFLGEPLFAVQLLWINLLSDALPALALGMDVPTRDLMADEPGHGRDILSSRNVATLLAQGAVLAGASVAALLAGHFLLALDYPAVRTMVFTTLVLAQLVHAINVRADGNGTLAPPRPTLWLAIGLSTLLQLGIIYTGVGNTVFRTVPLSAVAILWVLGASVLSMALVRLLKTGTAGVFVHAG